MANKIATFTLNPAYDLLGFCPKIELGDVNLVKTTGLLPAGKGINVAKVLCDLNHKVTASGFLGKTNNDGFTALFSALNLDNKFQLVEGRTRINVKLTEQNSDVTDLNFSGFTVSKNDWQQFVEQSLIWLADFDMVIISGSLPEGIALDDFTHWIENVKRICPKIIFDSSRSALIAGLKAKPWLIKPNDKELEMLVGHPLPTQTDIKGAAMSIVEQGIDNVIVSLGSKGALWVTKHESWLAKPPRCEVVSTVGAGDSMVAGLVHGLLSNYSIKDTLVFASAIAALSVSQPGVGVSDQAKLNRILEKIDVMAG
ncbi:1-phosphofructokinase [Orbus sturtevantii]|uniref:1-phosphofructokinase n=1 Tax=Orbus sturtevantii TaxID=3074109 RepID=UPI00370D8CED